MKYFFHHTWRNVSLAALCCLILLQAVGVRAETWRLGTWKTAQTIQPYVYDTVLGKDVEVRVSPFSSSSTRFT